LFENNCLFVDEHDRLIYAVSLGDLDGLQRFLQFIKKGGHEYLSIVKPTLDKLGVPLEPPMDNTYDPMDEDEYPSRKPWTENPTYQSSGKSKPKKLNKKDFVMDEAEEADEDNIASDEEFDTRSVRSNQSQSDRRRSKDDKILAIARSIVKNNPSMAKHKSNLCGCGEGRTITKGYDDGLCGPCRKKKNDKAKRRQLAEVKAKEKALEKRQKEIVERSAIIDKKRKMDAKLRELDELMADGSESDSGLSDSDSDQ
jgi:hypothetical protein